MCQRECFCHPCQSQNDSLEYKFSVRVDIKQFLGTILILVQNIIKIDIEIKKGQIWNNARQIEILTKQIQSLFNCVNISSLDKDSLIKTITSSKT